MGYHLTILRTSQGIIDPISSEEVRGLADRLDGAQIEPCSLKDGELNLVILRNGRLAYRFVLQSGKLWAKNPEDDEIQVLIDIASQLGARVRGDEFETFRTPTDTYVHPDDKPLIQKAEEAATQIKKTARHRQWILNLVLILFFAVLAGVAMYFSK
jgi:hypothetical protein